MSRKARHVKSFAGLGLGAGLAALLVLGTTTTASDAGLSQRYEADATVPRQSLTRQNVVRHFDETIFPPPVQLGLGQHGDLRLLKWSTPIVIDIDGSYDHTDRLNVKYAIKYFQEYVKQDVIVSDSIEIGDRIKSTKDSNFVFILGRDTRSLMDLYEAYLIKFGQPEHEKYRRSAELIHEDARVNCSHYYDYSNWSIKHVIILVRPPQGSIEYAKCLNRFSAKSLGMLGNPRAISERSIIDEMADHSGYSALDGLVLRMLYNALIEPGMTKDQAHPLLEQIMRDDPLLKRVVRQ
jgi:Protein of unknown function (DUF2927)